MTREETISILEESKRQNEIMRDNPSTFWASHQMADGVKNAERRIAALDIALSALRPVRREQVEKGEWQHIPLNMSPQYFAYKYNLRKKCSLCKYAMPDEYPNFNFCPACGAPMTDEAVEMVMERMEALHDTEN